MVRRIDFVFCFRCFTVQYRLSVSFCLLFVCTLLVSFEERRHRRRHRRDPLANPSPVVLRADSSASNTFRHSLPPEMHRQREKEEKEDVHNEKERHRRSQILSSKTRSKRQENSFHIRSDSDGESERLPVKPWSPSPAANTSSSSVVQYSQPTEETNTNQEDSPTSPSPQLTIALRAVFEMITEDLDKFVYTPAPNGLGDIQCRITRDKRGMEKGLFPTYYMHVERPGDGKKVCRQILTKFDYFLFD